MSAWADIITTGLNGLGNNSTVDVDIDLNTYRSGGSGSGVWPLYMNCALVLATLTPSSPVAISVFSLPAVDGTPTNYADENNAHIVMSRIPSTAAAAKYMHFGGYPIWRDGRYIRMRVRNQLGISLNAANNILRVQFRYDESV
jgi:hypothetical protein